MYYLRNSSLFLFYFLSLLHHPHGASTQEFNALQINQTSNILTLTTTDLLVSIFECFTVNVSTSLVPGEKELNSNMCQDSFSYGICCFDASFQLGVKCGQLHPPTGDEPHGSYSASFSRGEQSDLFDSPIIRLARWDYIDNLCPPNCLNAPLNELAPFSNYLPSASISSYFGEVGYEDDRYDGRSYFRAVMIIVSYSSVFCKFEVNQECLTCIDSGGACGYNQSSGRYVCYSIDEPHNRTFRSRNKGLSTGGKAGIGIASGLVVILLVAGLFCLISRLRKISDDPRQHNLKSFIPLKHYSYAQVKKITKSFAEVVGKGGFGIVYKGTLCDGSSVAVKILKDSKGDGEDFINEVSSMSKTSHVNIVSMLGFCSEGSKRAIIYEFVENGSLDKFISRNTSTNMDWIALYGIALGVARGLEYLHYGCKTRIVHFDIKPPNVLLDKNLCPKVSDFGLAKLCEKKESIMSLLDTRGTIGYIAPEMISRVYGSVSHKSDVYSYGMLVLEMIGARNKTSTEHSTSNASSMYFPQWIYKDLERRDNGRVIENGISSEEVEIAKKMTLVWWVCGVFSLHRQTAQR